MTELVNAAESQAVKNIVATVSKSSVKKKTLTQTTIIQLENPYLQKRVKNINRISLKMKEINA